QTFKTTPLQQLTAVCTVANGGNLVTPYVVSSLIDSSGNAQVTFEPKIKRQVVSSSVCESIMAVLEDGVSSGNGVKNAYVAGYRVAAKTGTSEKRDSADKTARIGSCVAVAPADDPQVCVIIIVDEPQISNKYGSNVAAPYAGALIEQVLSYLGVERRYTDEETSRMSVTVGNYKGMALEKAIQSVSSAGLTYEVVGNGTTVTSQIPAAGETLTNLSGKVYLYTGGETATTMVKVPDLVNKTADAAIKQLQASGLNVKLTGVTNYSAGAGATVIVHSPPAGTEVPYGSIVTLECRYLNETDGG
ncbi:MAG: PASTA domain-containing protein, partial [Clostridia bacterium]|nr:PASTA domain-containing protein [Clostridia bacterium]